MNAEQIAAAMMKLWCDWTHGGGHIDRDVQGRINWRCGKCGRWSDSPVPLNEEAAVIKEQTDAQ